MHLHNSSSVIPIPWHCFENFLVLNVLVFNLLHIDTLALGAMLVNLHSGRACHLNPQY